MSRTVAQNAASQSGLDPSVLRKMLPMVAMLVAGYMAKQGGVGAGAPASSGGGGLASMLDLDGDGNPLDDILNMAGKRMR